MGWRWVSAKSGEGVESAFLDLVEEILAHDITPAKPAGGGGDDQLRALKESVLSYHGRRGSITLSDAASRKPRSGCCGGG